MLTFTDVPGLVRTVRVQVCVLVWNYVIDQATNRPYHRPGDSYTSLLRFLVLREAQPRHGGSVLCGGFQNSLCVSSSGMLYSFGESRRMTEVPPDYEEVVVVPNGVLGHG